jgi:putative DNA primase/helicase
MTEHGCKDATRNEAQIRSWWEKSPNAMIGVATGEASWKDDKGSDRTGSDFDVIDFDVKNGGLDSYEKLVRELGPLPKTVKVLTGSGDGSFQVYFTPCGLRTTQGNRGGLPPGVDTRGNGGYVIVPPSWHPSGKRYQYAPGLAPWECKLAELPDRWRAALVTKAVKNLGAVEERDRLDLPVTLSAVNELKKRIAKHPNEDLRLSLAPVLAGESPSEPGARDSTINALCSRLVFNYPQVPDGLISALWKKSCEAMAKADPEKRAPAYFECVVEEKLRKARKAYDEKARARQEAEAQRCLRLGFDNMPPLTWGKGRDGKYIVASGENLRILLHFAPMLANRLRFDVFSMRPEYAPEPDTVWRALRDEDYTAIQNLVERRYKVEFSIEAVRRQVDLEARQNEFDPVINWLEGLRWDGKPRMSTWFPVYLGTADDAYHRAVARLMLVSLVARQYEPGVRVDTAVIFEGLQGILKSTMLASLVPNPDYFSDTLGDISSKDALVGLNGKLIIEWGELVPFLKRDPEECKHFLSIKQDHYRPPFGRNAVTIKRRNIFVGSTNESEYLRDLTGNRRYLPVRCSKIDLKRLEQERDQLFAEAVHAYKAGEKWWFETDEQRREAEAQVADRMVSNITAEAIDVWLEACPYSCFTSTEVLVSALNRVSSDKPNEREIARILNSRGWRKKQFRTGDKERLYLYFKDTAKEPSESERLQARERHELAVVLFRKSHAERYELIKQKAHLEAHEWVVKKQTEAAKRLETKAAELVN